MNSRVMRKRAGYGVLGVFLLAGCASVSSHPYAPKPFPEKTALMESLAWRYFDEGWMAWYETLPPEAQISPRNDYLTAMIILIDEQYDAFEDGLISGLALTETTFDVAVLGLTSAATLASGVAAKSILSAIASGLTGSRLALSRQMLAERSAAALVLQMRASRTAQLAVIRQGMQQPVDAYPLLWGVRDALRYVRAGTLSHALQAVAANAALAAQPIEADGGVPMQRKPLW